MYHTGKFERQKVAITLTVIHILSHSTRYTNAERQMHVGGDHPVILRFRQDESQWKMN
jgi:hypothetical protein